MAKEKEHALRLAFVSWLASQTPRAALVLPEVSISGKKIDLVGVEEPFDTANLRGQGSELLKRYQLNTWLQYLSACTPEQIRRLGVNKRSMDSIAGQLDGKKVWLVELKDTLTSEALGQLLVYKYHLMKTYPKIYICRSIVGCSRTDSVVEEVCTKFNVETILIDQ